MLTRHAATAAARTCSNTAINVSSSLTPDVDAGGPVPLAPPAHTLLRVQAGQALSRSTFLLHLNNQRTPGRRHRAEVDPFDRYEEYVAARLTEDPHVAVFGAMLSVDLA